MGGADIAGIVQRFASLKQVLQDCLEKMTSLETLKQVVFGISGAPLHNVAMFGDHAHTIQRHSTHAEVLSVVHQYTSWAGHEVMPHLLQSVCGEARKERETFHAELQSYRKKLMEYRHLQLWECPPLVASHALPSGGKYVLVKPVGLAEPTIFGLEQFHNKLVKSLNLPTYALRMCMVCGNCGGVVYCIPKGVYREVFKNLLTPEQLREASIAGVIELNIAGSNDPVLSLNPSLATSIPPPSPTRAGNATLHSTGSGEELDTISPDTPLTSQAKQHCLLICHTLWGPQMCNNSYQHGGPLVKFETLWPDLQRTVSIYQDAHLVDCCYELCKLLLASGSFKCLEGLLERKLLKDEQVFKEAGTVTLGHLIRALGPHSVPSNPSSRDNGVKGRKAGGTLSASVRDEIFLHATQPEMFYTLVMELQNNSFDVNSEKNTRGDLLIHVAVRQGLVSLPLMFVLVHTYKANIDARNTNGLTPLCLAAQLGDENMIEVMVCVFGADVNTCDVEHLMTPLHFAVKHNHAGVVSILLRRGADSGCEDRFQCDPAILARKYHALECVQVLENYRTERARKLTEDTKNGSLNVYLLNQSDLCVVNNDGMTLLMVAVLHNQVDLVRQLLAKTPCPLNYKQIKTFDLSNSIGAARMSVECEHTFKTAVCIAAEKGHTQCLAALIRAGAHPAVRDSQCWLPLHYAIWNGHEDCVEQILNCPTPHLGLVGLQAAIGLAENSHNDKILSKLREAFEKRQRTIVQPLLFDTAIRGRKDRLMEVLESGDNVNPTNRNGDWPLLLAAGLGHLEVVKLLHQYGGAVTALDGSLTTPLHQASRGGHLEVVRYLLGLTDGESKERLVDIDARNASGATPLELAACGGHGEVVKLLLEAGVSTTVPASDGQFVYCAEYSGIQHRIESRRKAHLKALLKALRGKKALNEFKRVWKGPCDFNLHLVSGENLLMQVAQLKHSDVLTFLIQELKKVKANMIVINPIMFPSTSAAADASATSEASTSGLGTQLDTSDNDPDSSITSLGTRTPSRLRFTAPSNLGTRSLSAIENRSVTQPDPMTSLTSLQISDYDFGGSLTSLNTIDNDSSGLGTQLDDLTGSLTSLESFLDTRPRLSPINSILEGNGEDDNDDDPHVSIQATLMRYQSPRDKQTALHKAILTNRSENAHILLSADPKGANIQDRAGNTPLHLACQLEHKRCLRVILSFPSVNTRMENNEGKTPDQCTSSKYFQRKLDEYRQNHEVESVSTDVPRTSSPVLLPASSPFSMDILEDEIRKLRDEVAKDAPDPHFPMAALDDEVQKLKEELARKRKKGIVPQLDVLDREIGMLKAALEKDKGVEPPHPLRLDQELSRLKEELQEGSSRTTREDFVHNFDQTMQQLQEDYRKRRNTIT